MYFKFVKCRVKPSWSRACKKRRALLVQLLNVNPNLVMPSTENYTRHKNLSKIFFNNRWIDFTKHNTRIVKLALMLVEKLYIM
jgi:hypothetical protein